MLQKLLKNSYFFLGFLVGISLVNGFFVFYPITDGDIFWHLSAGREMITKKELLYKDPFSFVPSNSKWINVHWLFQIIMYLLQKIGGWWALLFFKLFIISLATFFILLPFKNIPSNIMISLFFSNLIFFQRYLIPLRPIIFSLFFISIFIFSYEKYLVTNNKYYLLLIVLSQIAWVNSQGLFIVGPLIAFSYGYGEFFNMMIALRTKKDIYFYNNLQKQDYYLLLIFPFILLAVSFINPYFREVFYLLLRLISQITPLQDNFFSTYVPENISFVKIFKSNYFYYAYLTLFIFLLLIISLFFIGSKVRYSHLILSLIGLFSALMAQRNGILFTFLSLPALFWNFSELTFVHTYSKRGYFLLKAGVTLLIISLLGGIFIHSTLFFLWQEPISPFSYPSESISYFKKNSLICRNSIFNADKYGGYLIWHLYPQLQISYDTRWSMRDKNYFKEYISVIKNPSTFENFCQKKGFNCILLPLAPLDDYLLLAAKIYNSPQWKLIYTNGIEALFVKDSCNIFYKIDLTSQITVDSIAKELFTQFGKNRHIYKEALTYLNRFCAMCNNLRVTPSLQ